MESNTPTGTPTNARYWVIVFAVALAIIQYIDRVAISQAGPLIAKDLSLNMDQMSWIYSAFTLAYALFEIPTGYWGDRIGAKKVLIRVVLWWSAFTVATFLPSHSIEPVTGPSTLRPVDREKHDSGINARIGASDESPGARV